MLPSLPAGVGAGALSPEAEARLARGVGDPPLVRPPLHDHAAVAVWRAAIHAAWGEGTEGDEPAHEPLALACGRRALAAGPADAPLTVLYLHGGGYVLGSAGVAAPITARLAAADLRVVSLDYRLAPAHPFPAAVDDAAAAHTELRAAAPHRPVALAGDSAGGALALAVALRARLEGTAPPAALALFCPHLAHDPDPDAQGRAEDGGGRALADAYRDGHDPADPLLSPLLAPADLLAGLPPTLVQTGTLDR